MKAARTRALHRKHAGTSKHHHTVKHTPTAHRGGARAHKQVARRTATQVKAAHARAVSLGAVSCCTADALAWSLRLAGWPVDDSDVLALYKLTADSPDAGASIWATLDAAYRHGLAGVRPLAYDMTDPDHPGALLLGVDLPSRHTVLAARAGWLTWGTWFDPAGWPDAVIEEAWRVRWPSPA